jgi:hypothetical protein
MYSNRISTYNSLNFSLQTIQDEDNWFKGLKRKRNTKFLKIKANINATQYNPQMQQKIPPTCLNLYVIKETHYVRVCTEIWTAEHRV